MRNSPTNDPRSDGDPETFAKEAHGSEIGALGRELAVRFDRAGITGPLKDDVVQNEDLVVRGMGVSGMASILRSAYAVALESYAERFADPIEALIQLEYQGAKAGLSRSIQAAIQAGLSEDSLVPVVVAHNSLVIAIGSWGGLGVLGPTSSTSPLLEGQNV